MAQVFSLTLEGVHATSELVRLGCYDQVDDGRITNERFPLWRHDPIEREIELVEFDHEPTLNEVLAEFEHRGLERPTPEDAFYFGVQHPEEQEKHPIVFLHEPVRSVGWTCYFLTLSKSGVGRCLILYWLFDKWSRRYVFAGVRRVVSPQS